MKEQLINELKSLVEKGIKNDNAEAVEALKAKIKVIKNDKTVNK